MVQPDYEFKDLTVAQLRGVAGTFNVNLNGLTRKPDIVKAVEKAGITWEMYEALTAVPDESPALSFEDDLEPVADPVIEPVEDPAAEPVQEALPFEIEWPDYSADDADFVEEPAAPAPVQTEVVIVPVKEEEPKYTVVKMDRENRIYQVFGYEFTREAPFMLVKSDEADVLIEEVGGFRAASPRELREYYGE